MPLIVVSSFARIKRDVLSGATLRSAQERGVIVRMGRPAKPLSPDLPSDVRATLEVMRKLLTERGYQHKDLCEPWRGDEAVMSEGNVSKLLAGEQDLSLAQIKAFCEFVKISRSMFWSLVEQRTASSVDLEFDHWVQSLTPREKAAILSYEKERRA